MVPVTGSIQVGITEGGTLWAFESCLPNRGTQEAGATYRSILYRWISRLPNSQAADEEYLTAYELRLRQHCTISRDMRPRNIHCVNERIDDAYEWEHCDRRPVGELEEISV